MNKKLKNPAGGTILASGKRAGSIIKRAMICRTGNFWGMNGQVTVTEQMLQGICDKYKAEKKDPANDNDFAPILIDHMRVADNVMGRLLADGMEVGPWRTPAGQQEYGLFADLRVDDEEARANVESGKFAQLSISFDEEEYDLFEVSFVAVPAAQGSIILNRGGKKVDLSKKLERARAKHTALTAGVRERQGKRQAILSRLQTQKKTALSEAKAALGKIETLTSTIKLGQLKGRFQEFVKQGKMTPVEFNELEFKELAKLPETALKALEQSYGKRPVSEDVHMHGQAGTEAPKIDAAKLSDPAEMRKAMELQKSGKAVSLSTVVGEKTVVDDKSNLGEDEEADEKNNLEDGKPEEKVPALKGFALGEDDWKMCHAALEEAHGKLTQALEQIKGMGANADKLAEADEEDKKALGEADDDSDLADNDDEAAGLGEGDDKNNEDQNDEDKGAK